MLSLLKKFACSAKDVDVSNGKKRKGKNIEEKNDAPVYHEVDIRKHYDIKGLIGFPGSYGEVRAAVDVKTGKPYAIKMMTIQKHTENLIKAEIDIMKMLHHDNCAEIHAVYYMKKKVYIVMEKYDGGDLFDLVATKGGRFKDEKEAAQLVKQILQGLAYVHSLKIAHCDVKLCNILLTSDSKVKLIDFGVSQIVEDREMLHHEVGSPSFIAPEVIMGSYNERCDMWSLGCVAFILMFGFNPFNPKAMPALANKQKICETILKGFSSEVKAGYGAWFPEKVPVSDSFKEFVSALLTTEWKDRLTAEEALQHPWIVDNCS